MACKGTNYVNIGYSVQQDYDWRGASMYCDMFKYAGIKARTAHSCYVGQRTFEVDASKIWEAIHVLYEQGEFFVAECARVAAERMVSYDPKRPGTAFVLIYKRKGGKVRKGSKVFRSYTAAEKALEAGKNAVKIMPVASRKALRKHEVSADTYERIERSAQIR